MAENDPRSMLCHIMEYIPEFEFRTPEALRLKQEIRQWYYHGRDGGEAKRLAARFHSLFSGNMVLDASGDLLWALAEQSPLELSSPLSEAMSRIPRRHIIGRSVLAYGITAGGIQYQFEQWQTDASSSVDLALDNIEQQLKDERTWRKDNRMSLFSTLVSMAGIAALATGIWFLIPVVQALVSSLSLEDTALMFPSSWTQGTNNTLVYLGIFTTATGCLLYLLPRMLITICAGMLWIFYHKAHYNLRYKRMNQFRTAMRVEGLGGYFEKLRTAAQRLSELPPDAPQNQDQSRALLGRAGMDQVFQRFSLKPISGGRTFKKFYKKVEGRHIGSRAWIVILCMAVAVLRYLLLTGS